jgi:excisionase family DNA binding protein
MATTTQQGHFLTVDELGEFLRVSRTVAYQLVKRGEVPRVRVGSQWRIPRAELERQLDAATKLERLSDTPEFASELRRLAEDAPPETRAELLRLAESAASEGV